MLYLTWYLEIAGKKVNEYNTYHRKVILCTSFQFLLLVPARILTLTQIVKVAVNTDVGLPCVAVGHPKPKISWYFKRNRIIKRRRRSVPYYNEGKLILSNVKLNDAGTYNCSAVNQYGSDWNLVTLVVQGMLFSFPFLFSVFISTPLKLVTRK